MISVQLCNVSIATLTDIFLLAFLVYKDRINVVGSKPDDLGFDNRLVMYHSWSAINISQSLLVCLFRILLMGICSSNFGTAEASKRGFPYGGTARNTQASARKYHP
jgi:hypothetical protein